ncbi:MAG: Hsp20/alpha crystallin family protein [Clostridia bacterium]|nr:Hsp20/alpha crystallin family protein [Clostridia bacterium]
MKNFLTNRGNNDFGFNFFDDVFGDFFAPTVYGTRDNMKTDIKETENGYELAVDMPGFEKKDISMTYKNGYITISAERQEKEENKKNYIKRERSVSCQRSFYIGDEIREDDIKAKYNNGTLTVSIAKQDKKELPSHNIEIDD